jgi:hypothetical protein
MTTRAWSIGDRCQAPGDPTTLIIIDILPAQPENFIDAEAELQPANGKRSPRRWCKLTLLQEATP